MAIERRETRETNAPSLTVVLPMQDLLDYLIALFEKQNIVFGIAVPGFIVGAFAALTVKFKHLLGARSEPILKAANASVLVLALLWMTFLAWKDQRQAYLQEADRVKAIEGRVFIALDCRRTLLPKKSLNGDSLYFMELGRPNDRRLGLAERYANPDGGDWNWPDGPDSYRCDVINVSSQPVSNIILNFKIEYVGIFDWTTEEGKITSINNPEFIRSIRVPFAAAGGMFSFYVSSNDGADAEVDLPETALVNAGETAQKEVKVVVGRWKDMSFHNRPGQKTRSRP